MSKEIISNDCLENLLNAKLEEDKEFIENINYLEKLLPENDITERKLKIALENRELELNYMFLESFEKINNHIQTFFNKIQKMNTICHDLTDRIQNNKEKTRDLLQKTSMLQIEKKKIISKQENLNCFFATYFLSDEENAILTEFKTSKNISEQFLTTLKRLVEINNLTTEQLKLTPNIKSLNEILEQNKKKLDDLFENLHQAIIQENRFFNIDYLDVKSIVCQSFQFLQMRSDLFQNVLKEYSLSRKVIVVRSFIDALTKDKGSVSRPIENFLNTPLKYVSEMLFWIQNCLSIEKKLILSILKDCNIENISLLIQDVLLNISKALCQPLRVRVEQVVLKEKDPIILFKFFSMFSFYAKKFELEINSECLLIKMIYDLRDLVLNMFYGMLSSNIQRILTNMTVPDYNLLPVNAVHQTLLFLRDVLKAQTDKEYEIIISKKDIYLKIFAHILDPLHQSIQLVCSNLHNPLDVAVYMLNCLNAIRSVVILYPYTETKLEMIKAQIDANEDVLVSEQVTQILLNCDLMDIYTKCLAHQPNQGSLSKIKGVEVERVEKALLLLDNFLKCKENFQCNQFSKIFSPKIRESIQLRTIENFVSTYEIIYNKLNDAENEYVNVLKNLKTPEKIKEEFMT